MTAHRRTNLRLVRTRHLRQELRGLDDHAVITGAALDRLFVNQRLLHGMQLGRLCQSLLPGVPHRQSLERETDLPATRATGVTHDRVSTLSTSTEQDPHCARPQPNRGPCRCSSFESTYNNGVSGVAAIVHSRSFTLRVATCSASGSGGAFGNQLSGIRHLG